MKLFLLIFCLVCISVTTSQRCTRNNETYTTIAKPQKTKTAEWCTAKCDKSPDCVSWTWNKQKKKCYLSKEFDLADRTPWISGNCGGEEFDFGPYMDSLEQAFKDFKANTSAEIFSSSSDSCSFADKMMCMIHLGKGIFECRKCKTKVTCWIPCIKEKICNLESHCIPGGPCFNDLLIEITSALGGFLPATTVNEILGAITAMVCFV